MKCVKCNQKLSNRFLLMFKIKRPKGGVFELKCPHCDLQLLISDNTLQWYITVISLIFLSINVLSYFTSFIYYMTFSLLFSFIYAGLTVPINQLKEININIFFYIFTLIFGIGLVLTNLNYYFIPLPILSWIGMCSIWHIAKNI